MPSADETATCYRPTKSVMLYVVLISLRGKKKVDCMVESFAGHMTVSNFIGHNIAIYVFLLHVMSPNNYKYYYCFMFLSNFLSHRHRRRHHYVIIARSNSTPRSISAGGVPWSATWLDLTWLDLSLNLVSVTRSTRSSSPVMTQTPTHWWVNLTTDSQVGCMGHHHQSDSVTTDWMTRLDAMTIRESFNRCARPSLRGHHHHHHQFICQKSKHS